MGFRLQRYLVSRWSTYSKDPIVVWCVVLLVDGGVLVYRYRYSTGTNLAVRRSRAGRSSCRYNS
jgi:hypothetical protein